MNTRITATFTALVLASAAALPVAHAGDREWAVAGKVLTGIAAAHVIGHAIAPRTTVVYQAAPAPMTYVAAAPVAPAAPVYAPTTAVVYQPAPVVVYAAPPTVVYVAAPAPFFVSGPPMVVHPYGHYHRPRHCFSRW